MEKRVKLSVGLTQDFANSESRAKFLKWLEIQAPACQQAKDALEHVHAIEGLLAIEKYATLSNMAAKLRDDLAAIRSDKIYEHNKGYQAAINLVMGKIEDIDGDTQAATSIAEMQTAAVLNIADEMKDPEDCRALHDYAKAIVDGCC